MNRERGIGEKCQAIIPKDIQKFLGLHKGQKAMFDVRENKLV